MTKALRVVCVVAAVASLLGLGMAVSESPRDFRPGEWRRYERRTGPFGDYYDDIVADRDLRPFGAWLPETSLALLALHLGLTLALAARAGWRLRGLLAVRRGAGAPEASPYRRAPEGPPGDVAGEAAARAAKGELVAFALAAVLPCVTTMREVIVLRAAGTVVRATPTEVGWFQDVMRNSRGGQRSIEAHGVRARATVGGRDVALEARCGFGLTMSLDGGRLPPGSVPFVVWERLPSVHQIGAAPVVGHVGGWAHVALLAGMAAWWATSRDERRKALEAAAVG